MQSVLSHPDFAEGKVSTRWVEDTIKSNGLPIETRQQAPGLLLIAAALAEMIMPKPQSNIDHSGDPDPYSPWKVPGGFRIGGKNG
jgi:hypothetical protein